MYFTSEFSVYNDGKTFGYNTMTNFKSLKDINIPNYIATSQQSTKYGTFYNKGKAKPSIKLITPTIIKQTPIKKFFPPNLLAVLKIILLSPP